MSNTENKQAIPGINDPTQEDKSRIASTQDKAGKDTGAGTFAAHNQSTADKAAGAEQKPEEKKKEEEENIKYTEPE